jgi:hypothetical protein
MGISQRGIPRQVTKDYRVFDAHVLPRRGLELLSEEP